MRLQLGRLLFCISLTGTGMAQSFDAAAVKPADPAAMGSTFQFPPGGRLRISNATLRQIIETA
ncbi:MAG TPA: hypothetical protein VHC90_14770 [Bryobacteraceae bacterium]|nr:hypothetical protein [Bryobacteraceae bacterium]